MGVAHTIYIRGESTLPFSLAVDNNLIMSSSAVACNCVMHELANGLWHHGVPRQWRAPPPIQGIYFWLRQYVVFIC